MKFQSTVSFFIIIIFSLSPRIIFGQGFETAFPRGERSSCVLSATIGYYLVGADDSSKLYLHRINDSGTLLWTKTYGVSGMVVGTYPSDIIYTPEKNLLIVGSFWPGSGIRYLYILKIDTLGNTIWEKIFSITQADEIAGKKAAISPNGDYLITGTRSLANQYDIVLVKMDSAGNFIWNKLYNVARDDVNDILITSDNEYFICGNVGYSPTLDSTYAFITKIDSAGVIQWMKLYGESDKNSFEAIHFTSDSNLILTGYTQNDSNFWENYWLYKIDINGDSIWQRKYYANEREMAFSLTEINNKYYLSGMNQTNSPPFYNSGLIKEIDSSGNLIWSRIYSRTTYFTDIAADSTNQYFVACGSTTLYGNNSLYLIKLFLNGTLNYVVDINSPENINIYPTPTSEKIFIQSECVNKTIMIIYDHTYKTILKTYLEAGQQTISIDVSDFTNGIYTLVVVDCSNSNINASRKFIVSN